MSYIDPPRKLLYHLDRLAAIKAGGTPPPVNVEIDLSNRCNLGCAACDFAQVHSRGPWAGQCAEVNTGDLMDTEAALRLLHDFDGVRSVTWTGGGEPTLHPDFVRITSAWPGDQGLYTNGTLIDENLADYLKRRMTWVYVSLDQAGREAYYYYKGRDLFPRVCDAVGWLVQAEGAATIGVGFLLNECNWRDVLGMVTLGRELRADYVQFRPMVEFDPEVPGQPLGDRSWIDHCLPLLERIGQAPDVEVDTDRFEQYRDWQGHGYDLCYWSTIQAVISPDGSLWGCCNKRGQEDALLGNVLRWGFSETWQYRPIQPVNASCRVMCRGHIPNLTLARIMDKSGRHRNFV